MKYAVLVVTLCLGCGDDADPDGGVDGGPSDVGVDASDAGVDAPVADTDLADVADDARQDVPSGMGRSIRFRGQGETLGDRFHIRLDDPETVEVGPPIDIGAGDFTIEMWLRPEDNPNPGISCGNTNDWVTSNIFIDRDRHSQPPHFGAGIAGGVIVFSTGTEFENLTMCGSTNVLDDAWHHIVLQRRASDGHLWIYVDGQLDAEQDGPDGDISYPDDGVPMAVCPEMDGVCDYSDPFLVFGAEKHGYGDISYSGYMDEVRISTVLRYPAAFDPPTAPFETDSDTVALYHLDELGGDTVVDASGMDQTATVLTGGDPLSPTWEMQSPF